MENLVFGIQVAVIGMVVVLAALTLLAILTDGLSRILGEPKAKKEKSQTTKVTMPTREEPVKTEEDISPQTIAIITAAVAALNTRSTYRVTTIKRIESDLSPSWTNLARQEQGR